MFSSGKKLAKLPVQSLWADSRLAVSVNATDQESAASTEGVYTMSYVHFIEPRWEQLHSLEDKSRFLASFVDEPTIAPFKRILDPVPIVSAGGWNPDNCWDEVEEDRADALAFGRLFLANPDFVDRMRKDLPLNMYNRATFYMGRHAGYTDYPDYDEAKQQKVKWWGEPEILDPNEYMEEL